MTSHAKRIQALNQKGVIYNHPQSIMSGSDSGSVSSQNSTPVYHAQIKRQPSIPEDSVMLYNSSNEPMMYQQKQNVKFSSGPCSSIISSKASTITPSIGSRLSISSDGKIKQRSQSLGGSKASLASEKSHKSTIQQEFHDIKVNRKINALSYGPARRPFIYSVICFVVGFVFFVIGLTVIMLRLYGQLFLTMDKGEIIGPIFIVGSVILVGVGIKFVVDAYRMGAAERRRLGFRACGRNMVTVKIATKEPNEPNQRDALQSGTSSNQAVRKVLHMEQMESSQAGSLLQ